MKYAYEDLSPDQFERLVVALCQHLLGSGTQGFAPGPDGGRDAKFVGTAQLHPSTTAPWTGTVIIQAKHTNGYNKSFSDAELYSSTSKSSVLASELPRIVKLHESKGLDHYMLFSNRRLTGGTESELRTLISKACNIPEASIALCGLEQLELWTKRFPDVAKIAGIDPVDSPLLVSPDELAEVVEHLAKHLSAASSSPAPPTDRVFYEQKNLINSMSKEYARELRTRYLKDTAQVKGFLAAPENAAILERYELAAEEFQLNVIAKRKDYQSFDEVITYLINLLLDRDPILRKYKRLTRTMVFYMYWNCDLGENNHAAT